MAVVTIKMEVNQNFDLEVASDLASGTATFSIINSNNSNVLISGPLQNLVDLCKTFEEWQKSTPHKLKAFSRV